MPRSHAILDALPAYLGGKRALLGPIFTAIRKAGYQPAEGHRLVDAFAGGCSVALWGKALGYQVAANDISLRSEAIGKAFVQNDTTRLTREDAALIVNTDASDRYLPPIKTLPWPDPARLMLAQIAKCADEAENEARAALMRSLLMKVAGRISMWGQVNSSGGRRIREQRWDEIPPTQGRAGIIEAFMQPKKILVHCIKTMEPGVFPNGQHNEVECKDVLEFLSNVKGDVAYFDPPYPGTESYERNYGQLDGIMANRDLGLEVSRFSKGEGWKFLEDVFVAARHIPVWVLSLGNEVVDVEALTDLMKQCGRTHVHAQVLDYAHLESKASAEKTARNKEYILTAKEE